MTRYDYRDRTAASPNPLKEAEAKASELAGALRKLAIQEMNQGVGNRVAATVQRVNGHVSSLEAALAEVQRSPNEKSAQALDDAFFVIDNQIDDLFTGIEGWASRAEAAMKGIKALTILHPTMMTTLRDSKAPRLMQLPRSSSASAVDRPSPSPCGQGGHQALSGWRRVGSPRHQAEGVQEARHSLEVGWSRSPSAASRTSRTSRRHRWGSSGSAQRAAMKAQALVG